MVGKALLATAKARAEVANLAPTQVGVGVPSAADNVAMGAQAMVNRLGSGPTWALLKVDLKNAFNCVDRFTVLSSAAARCPTAYNFLHFAYAATAPLFCAGRELAS